jgi:hypothetical protein
MTEAELFESAQTVWSNYITCMSIFITIVSAYLIVAYIAGRNLTRPQVILVNALFVSFSVYAITAMYGFSRVATELASLSIGMSTQRSEVGVTTVPTIALLVFIPLASACLKFMWDVRHPKT